MGPQPDVRMRLQAALAERDTIERELGRGGMATVYLARDRKHDRAVGLKVLKPDLAAALGPDRFLREIRSAVRGRRSSGARRSYRSPIRATSFAKRGSERIAS